MILHRSAGATSECIRGSTPSVINTSPPGVRRQAAKPCSARWSVRNWATSQPHPWWHPPLSGSLSARAGAIVREVRRASWCSIGTGNQRPSKIVPHAYAGEVSWVTFERVVFEDRQVRYLADLYRPEVVFAPP